ncbi:hypothetical protein [Kitasatospora sp. NPDC050543]|uniref:hypothetical protein n=1 Tax=Kitasatospora sp. NPDC050543 TaxID=3364054 RepID=UPI0037B91865
MEAILMPEANLPARREPLAIARRTGIPEPLELADVRDLTVTDLADRGVHLVRAYAQLEHAGTTVLKSLAAVLVSIRLSMDDPNGSSYEYTQLAAQIYLDAGIAPEPQSRVKANVRYHISELLREVLSPKELTALGLHEKSARNRMADRRSVNTAIVASARAAETADQLQSTDGDAEAPVSRLVADHLKLATTVTRIIDGMQPDVIRKEMTPAQRRVLDERYAQAIAQLQGLRKVIRTVGK